MKRLEVEDTYREFWLEVSPQYPNLTFEDFKGCIEHLWKSVAIWMGEGDLEKIRLKNFGTFVVYPGAAKGYLRQLYPRLEKGYINSSTYFRTKKNIETFLENYIKEKEDD